MVYTVNSHNQQVLHTIDLNFQGVPGTIASYLISHQHGAILIESGPGTTLESLQKGLSEFGYELEDVHDVLLTHIHLDHAGAAGALAKLGAKVYVHHIGAPHLLNPEKLVTSAERIYGEMMDQLWGEIIPIDSNQLIALQHNDVVEIEGIKFRAIDTPGHANHHMVYIYEDVCFSGDIAGVRLFNSNHMRIPMPPPELNLIVWVESLRYLLTQNFSYIAPTHFGIYPEPHWYINKLIQLIETTDQWISKTMSSDPSLEALSREFNRWTQVQAGQDNLTPEQMLAYETANPTWMSASGIMRYWQKFKARL